MENKSQGTRVHRRRVFYIPGYDPIPPRRYRELYRKESAAQAEISGYEIELAAKTVKTGSYGWRVHSTIEDAKTTTDVDVLVWSDIVRDSMENSILATYLQLIQTAWIYISTGALGRLMTLRKGPVIAALYPIGMLLAQALLAGLLVWGTAWACIGVAGLFSVSGFFVQSISLLLGLLLGVGVLRWFKKLDGKFFAYYLMHDYAYSASSKGAYSPDLEGRIAEFTVLIRTALNDDQLDEVLVVGHSSGAHIAVSVLSDMIRTGLPDDHPTLGFLSLGQVVPMVSFLPKAYRLRGDLKFLSQRDELAWVDVTAPGDGCAFALCDPVSVSGVGADGKLWPLVFSAAFTQTLSPQRWAELRWRFFRLHFQYLCAFDQPGDYDYFQITAGPVTLQERYRDRKPSQSRIDQAVSKYTAVSAT
ncbi:hypothetical protein [Parasedimentitalea denitrificans]|uniref:hypothetical protein n=1 Tax=Parasedimentitalea denitrificans TaxID=2211118 RepID=UPI003F72C579